MSHLVADIFAPRNQSYTDDGNLLPLRILGVFQMLNALTQQLLDFKDVPRGGIS